MSEIASTESSSTSSEKPGILGRLLSNNVEFPPFPEPTEEEFEEDIGDEERTYYRNKFADLHSIKNMRLHCSACDRHLGSSTRNESRMRAHPMLRTLVCHTCHTFYNSGEFEKGDDGSELYCRWCGQGGQVYCCSDCPHVFCAKCIKRNLGVQKIKEIENTDDWKCFKCNPKCLWDLRAVCWALLRYCDVKNKITYKTEDPALKEAFQKDCALDHTDCCKHKSSRRKEKVDVTKKKEDKKVTNISAIPKIPSSIQVKKFASINLDEPAKDVKARKRSANPVENKVVFIKNPIAIAPKSMMTPVGMPPTKKPRMPVANPVRFVHQERKPMNNYARIRPKLPTMPIPIISQQFNGYSVNNSSFPNYTNMVSNDTLNLSLESLTQGLDMVAVAAMNNNSSQDDDVVCTPDLPLEPLCEVTEDNTDDDVQCITPGPVAAPKLPVPPLVPCVDTALPDLSSDNIVQMTDNDVTVNAVTGGLKFRVDPQTLSSNKMYRLPDGRIFAIKANPNMPGGYSATIVAVTETGQAKSTPKGATYAAKLSAVSSIQTSPSPRPHRNSLSGQGSNSKRNTPKSAKVTRGTDTSVRECDLQVPVEWYRFNLVDAVDALEYSLQRLHKLKKEATCRFLRTRSIEEMKSLHRTLDRLLNTSATRFNEIKDNLNRELKQYITKKMGGIVSDDDDDVEILPDLDDNDDPIFIDENSIESNSNDVTCNESQEVDLTGVGSSDHNDSAEIMNEDISKQQGKDHLPSDDSDIAHIDSKIISSNVIEFGKLEDHHGSQKVYKKKSNKLKDNDKSDLQGPASEDIKNSENDSKSDHENSEIEKKDCNTKDDETNKDDAKKDDDINDNETKDTITKYTDAETKDKDKNDNGNTHDEHDNESDTEENVKKEVNGNEEQEKQKTDIKGNDKLKENETNILSSDNGAQDNDCKIEDSEMSEEMIETLLSEDNAEGADNILINKSMEVVESI